jgi:hypothetical protein
MMTVLGGERWGGAGGVGSVSFLGAGDTPFGLIEIYCVGWMGM